MKTPNKVQDYQALTDPFFQEFDSVPRNTSKQGTPRKHRNTSNTSNMNNTSTPRKKGKKSKQSVLIAKTYKLPSDLISAIQRIAYWRRVKIQDVVADALTSYINEIPPEENKPIPKK